MKKCVVDIRYHAAVGDYSRILVVLTSHQGERKMEETKRSGMSKDQFWNLIEKAKEVCGTDLDASAVWIKQQLFYMTPEDVLQFHNLVYSYRDAAYKYGLWTAAGILMETGCSDDSFSDFLACGNAYPVFFSAVAAVIYRTHSAGNESALAVEPDKFLVIFKSDSKKHGNSAS